MLKCQKDSYAKIFDATVVSIGNVDEGARKALLNLSDLKRLKDQVLTEVVLDDTILFPEGGGQPDDRGLIGEANVERVIRRGLNAVHVVSNGELLETGMKVNLSLDWERRFDHMQQHSGQHLITAIMASFFGRKTKSWWLGTTECYIELEGDLMTEEDLQLCEFRANELIRDSVPVSVAWVKRDDPILVEARSRGVPDDVGEEIRVVTIEDLESNVCCGTHVAHLGQLQLVKLLSSAMHKGKHVVHFLAGGRAFNRLSKLLNIENQLFSVFKVKGDDLPAYAAHQVKNLKGLRKAVTVFSNEVIAEEAKKFRAVSSQRLVYHYNRNEGDFEFGYSFLREIGPTPRVGVLITMRTDGNNGFVLLRGSEIFLVGPIFELVYKTIERILDGQGFVRAGVYQGRVKKFNKMNDLVSELRETFKI